MFKNQETESEKQSTSNKMKELAEIKLKTIELIDQLNIYTAEKKALQDEKSALQYENKHLHEKINVLEKAQQTIEKPSKNKPKNKGLAEQKKKKQQELEMLRVKYMEDSSNEEDW